jgi:hypothetical protein
MEVLAGARNPEHLLQLRALLGLASMRHCRAEDYEAAALIYRHCRKNRETVRRLIDCLMADPGDRKSLGSPVPSLQHTFLWCRISG